MITERFTKANKYLFNKWSKWDYLIFFILIPFFNVCVFFLPLKIKSAFQLNIQSPNIISIFMSNYTHIDPWHITSNLIAYFIIIFLIFNLETDKRRLYKILLISLLAVPFILYLSTGFLFSVYKINMPPLLGFSGIVCFYLGYLLYVEYQYFKNKYYNDLKFKFVFLILFLNIIIWIFFNTAETVLKTYAIIGSLILLLLLIYDNRINIKVICKGILSEVIIIKKGKKGLNYYKYILTILLIIFSLSLSIIIPRDVKVNNQIINILAHYVGYLLGIFVPLILDKLKSLIKVNKH